MRRIEDPLGMEWSVDVVWTNRYLGSRIERRLDGRNARRGDRNRDLSWIDDGVETLGVIGEMGTLGIMVVVAVLSVALTFAWGPFLFVLVLDVVELLLFPLIAAGIIAWRVGRRHAFPVVAARRGDAIARWRVVGVREARRVEQAIAEAIKVGGDVELLFIEYREPSPPPAQAAG